MPIPTTDPFRYSKAASRSGILPPGRYRSVHRQRRARMTAILNIATIGLSVVFVAAILATS
jgi:amino acid transporter